MIAIERESVGSEVRGIAIDNILILPCRCCITELVRDFYYAGDLRKDFVSLDLDVQFSRFVKGKSLIVMDLVVKLMK